MLAVVIEQRLLVLRELEEPVLLANPFRLGVVDRTVAVDEVLLGLERLAADAIPAFVGAFVDIAVVETRLRHRLHGREMPLPIGGADEIVEREVEPLPHAAKDLLHLVAVRERILPRLGSLAKHVLRVLVVAHQEMGVEARQAAVSRDDVGGDFFVGRAEMRPAVHEIDRRGQEVTHYSVFVILYV
jgi:hypothetical protein